MAGKFIDWDAQPLGVEKDIVIAKRLGVSREAVRQARQKRGIDKAPNLTVIDKIDISDISVSELSNEAIAKKLGISIATVHKLRKSLNISTAWNIDWDSVPFGDLADHEIAYKYNVAVGTVKRQRTARGIPHNFRVSSYRSNVDWSKQPLGKIPDCTIAKHFGIASQSVRRYRMKFGIPIYSRDVSKMSPSQYMFMHEDCVKIVYKPFECCEFYYTNGKRVADFDTQDNELFAVFLWVLGQSDKTEWVR